MAASEPSSTAPLQGEATTTTEATRTPELCNKDRPPAHPSSSKFPGAPDVLEDGRALYLGTWRQRVMSGTFFLLLVLSWLAVVLTNATGQHSGDVAVRPPPSHISDYPLPPDGAGPVLSAASSATEGSASSTRTARHSINGATKPTKSTARSRISAAATSAWSRLQLWRQSLRNRTTPASYSGHEMESSSEPKKNLWCAYNGSDPWFRPHHLPLHLCSAVVLCCLPLTAPHGEPSAPNLRFADFLKIQDASRNTRPSLLVALAGPQQDSGVLRSLAQRDHGNASKRLAVHVLHFVEFNRLDGVLLYTLHCGPDEVAIYRALYERLDYHGYTAAVTCPDGEGGTRLFAEAKLGPVVLIPTSANSSRTQCPLGLARRVLDDAESATDVMLGVQLSGLRYTFPEGGAAIGREGAAASLVSSAAYRDVCLAIRDHGWSGYGSSTGECVVAHRNRTWMAALTPWALAVPGVVGRFAKAGVVVLDVDADDAGGSCGARPFPLTDALHRLL
ncbi:uncharacterized protein [Dermacentor albipictus]|uniref:uncharacterized protein n=1 Tax=Dermacentor albipictus TaxID=60249 RepID=UPI0038FC6E8B